MTRKQIEGQLRKWGFHDLMNDERTLCAYEQLYTNLRANRIALKDVESLTLDQQGEIRAELEGGFWASVYLSRIEFYLETIADCMAEKAEAEA